MSAIKTSKTFDTPAEAAAFMLGFRAAKERGIWVLVDEEEPQAILVDLADDRAEERWNGHCQDHRKELAER